jgi:hypothetical protein
MLMTKERSPSIRTLRRLAISALREAGAVPERKEHGWLQDRADPHGALTDICYRPSSLPARVPTASAEAAIADVLDSMGDTGPNCRPKSSRTDLARLLQPELWTLGSASRNRSAEHPLGCWVSVWLESKTTR